MECNRIQNGRKHAILGIQKAETTQAEETIARFTRCLAPLSIFFHPPALVTTGCARHAPSRATRTACLYRRGRTKGPGLRRPGLPHSQRTRLPPRLSALRRHAPCRVAGPGEDIQEPVSALRLVHVEVL